MTKKYLLIILLSTLLISVNPIGMQSASSDSSAFNSENLFLPVGPEGGSVPALAVDPEAPATVFAGTANGVYRSTDGGINWISAGLWNIWIYALAVNPYNSSIVYAGTRGKGIFKSVDGGVTWQPANKGIEDQVVYALAIDPVDPNTLYIGARSINSGLNANLDEWDPGAGQTPESINSIGAIAGPPWGGGVSKSTDGGQNWKRINNGLTEDWVYALAIDPTDPTVVYAGTHTQGVFKSTNKGDNWVRCSDFSWLNGQIRALAIDPWNHDQILAGTWHGGIVITTNAGKSWNQGDLVQYKIRTLAYGPGEEIYAGTWGSGVFRSTKVYDNGYPAFDQASNGLWNYNVNFIAMDPSNAKIAYGGFDSFGTLKTTNTAGSWFPARSGLTSTVISALVTQPGAPNTLYAGILWDGIFKSDDGGTSWYDINAGLGNTYVHSLAINSASPLQVFAGTEGGVFISQNSGGIWNEANIGLPITTIISLALFPAVSPTVYAGTLAQGVYISQNGGGSWAQTALSSFQINTLLVDPRSPGTVYAGTDANGLYKSINYGVNWSSINLGLGNVTIKSLAVDPTQPNTVYAGTAAGIFMSTDGGASWKIMGISGFTVISILVDPANPLFVYAGTSNNGFFRFDVHSDFWVNITKGLYNPSIAAITLSAFPTTVTQPVGHVSPAPDPAYPAPDSVYPAPGSQVKPPPVTTRSIKTGYSFYLPMINNTIFSYTYFPMIIYSNYPPVSILVGTLGGGVYRITLNNNTLNSVNSYLPADVDQAFPEGSTK